MTVNINDYPTIQACHNEGVKSKPKISIDALMELITYVRYVDDTLTNHSTVIENLRKDVLLIKKSLDNQSDLNECFRNVLLKKETGDL